MIWFVQRRRLAAWAAIALWVWTLLMWGATPLATAQPGPPAGAVRIMDGTHNQLATVNHVGELLVNTGGASGITSHITSVTHISGAVMIRNTAGTAATFTGTSLDVNCTGCAAASVVNVAHVSAVTHVAGTVTARQGFTVADVACHETTAIHQTSSTQVIHGTGGFRIGICGILLVSAHAQGLSMKEGLGTVCAGGQRPLIGSNRVDDSVVTAANGGFSTVAPSPWLTTQATANNICVMQTGTGSVSGVITWRPVP